MELTLSGAVADRLLELAAESRTPVEKLLEALVEEEDRRRHVTTVPYEGEVRMKCRYADCFETRPRPTARDTEEV